jgi:hypothetical protein
MRVITYSPNFGPPHFAARGIPKDTPHGTMEGHTAYIYMLSVYPVVFQKNTPHGTMEGHTAYIYMLSVYPFWMELFSFSLYTNHTLLHGLIFFVKYGKC